MSAAMNRTQSNNQTAHPKIWELIEDTKMESTNRPLTGQLNNSRNSQKSHLAKTLAVMAMGALLTASALFSGSTASADEANQPLAKEQVVRIANWDAYVDARDIQTSGPGLNLSNKLVYRNSSTVENWDVYADGRDILPKVKQVNMMDSDFDAYMDARDINLS